MPHKKWEIVGKIVNQDNNKGIEGLLVEAWDKDWIADDLLGADHTNADGAFSVTFDSDYFKEFFDKKPDVFFLIYDGGELIHSTESNVLMNLDHGKHEPIIKLSLPKEDKTKRDIYLKIEVIPDYCPVEPMNNSYPPNVTYRRDCRFGEGHENGTIPNSEVEGRTLNGLVYREYLDPDYFIPKADKIVESDINEPVFDRRVPGTVIYAHPGELLCIHVLNGDLKPHSFHVHGISYGIDSDGAWPHGTQNTNDQRSDEICFGQSWTYTFCVTEEHIGVWPFHDHSRHTGTSINRGLFGGIVVLPKVKAKPIPRPIRPIIDLQDFLVKLDKPRFKMLPEELRAIDNRLAFVDEWIKAKLLAFPDLKSKTLHVPLFFHLMKSGEGKPLFDTGDIEEMIGVADLIFINSGDFDYFCQHHPSMTGTIHVVDAGGGATVDVYIKDGPGPGEIDRGMNFYPEEVIVAKGGTVHFINQSDKHHTATSVQGASIPSHSFNGRSFIGNSPTIVGKTGQKIRWYIFNLDVGHEWHNFHTHSQRWKLGNETIDVRSLGPAESFMVETEVPPVLLLTEEMELIQNKPNKRPPGTKLYKVKGDFLFHCHVHHHMNNGMIGLVRARQKVWLSPDMVAELEATTGLPLDDGSNDCPAIDLDRCAKSSIGSLEPVAGGVPADVMMMHACLLPGTERVLFWGEMNNEFKQSQIYDAATDSFLDAANRPADLPGENMNTSNLWSAAHAFLDDANGTLVAHGGLTEDISSQPTKSYTFDPLTLTWAQTGNTADPRFYASTFTLPDGKLITFHGSAGGFQVFNTLEVYDPAAGTWSAPKNLPAEFNQYLFYPWIYQLPDGELFIAGPQRIARKFDWTVNPIVNDLNKEYPNTLGVDRGDNMEGTSVLLTLRPPNYNPVILNAGGEPAVTKQSVEMIDLSDPLPGFKTDPAWALKVPRTQCTSVLLPNGRIFIGGGAGGSGDPDGKPIEVFDPQDPAQGWKIGPTLAHPRLYHSSMVLLPDGSILIGGDAYGIDPSERYYPDYFSLPRPVIDNAPAQVAYGANINIDCQQAGSIGEVVMLSTGAVTHSFNMTQRAVELVINSTGGGVVEVVSPPNPNIAPPGWYLLFVLDGSRVPSEGRWIRITP